MLKFTRRFIILFSVINYVIIAMVDAGAKLPVPRFASIKFNEVNVRSGPARDCPIEWVFVKKGEPVEIIAEFDQWVKIRDIEGEGGWAHLSVLSGNRYVVVQGKKTVDLLGAPGKFNSIIVHVKSGLRCRLIKCQDSWCNIRCGDYSGYVMQKNLWGCYLNEEKY